MSRPLFARPARDPDAPELVPSHGKVDSAILAYANTFGHKPDPEALD